MERRPRILIRRWLTPFLLLACGAVGAACQAEVIVDIDIDSSGAGQVEATLVLDDEAADAILDLEGEGGLRLDDLVAAGWELTPPTVADNGEVRTSAVKPFGSAEQLSDVMNEVTGLEGVFAGFELIRDESFAEVDLDLRGAINPAALATPNDPSLEAALGVPLSQLLADEGYDPASTTLTVRSSMPGTVREGESTGLVQDVDGSQRRVWRTTAAGPAVEIREVTSTREVAALVWRGVAVVAGVLAAVVLLGSLLRLLLPERRRRNAVRRPGSPSATRRDGAASGPAGDAGPNPSDGELNGTGPQVVALDGMGVLYREGDDIDDLLVPFVRSKGSTASHEEITARARQLSLGRLTAADFWWSLGLHEDANDLDSQYLERFHLTPGVVQFMQTLRSQNIRVACVTNDCTSWANRLRVLHGLDDLVDIWVVSGAVGVRKPDRPIYEVLRRVAGAPPSAILVIDDDERNLDAAADYGFATLLFAANASADTAASNHRVLRRFPVSSQETETENAH